VLYNTITIPHTLYKIKQGGTAMTNLLSNEIHTTQVGILGEPPTSLIIFTNRQKKNITVVNGLIYIWWDETSKSEREYDRFIIRYCTADGGSGFRQSNKGQTFDELFASIKADWEKNLVTNHDSDETRENIERELAVLNGTLEETEKRIAERQLTAEIYRAERDAYVEADCRAFDALQIGSVVKTNLTPNDHVARTQEEIDALHEWVVVAKRSQFNVTVHNLKKLDLVGTRKRDIPFSHLIFTGKVVEVK
jgi:hypothetical protein